MPTNLFNSFQGKTLQTISFLGYLKERKTKGSHLVVCPLSVLSTWMNEIKRYSFFSFNFCFLSFVFPLRFFPFIFFSFLLFLPKSTLLIYFQILSIVKSSMLSWSERGKRQIETCWPRPRIWYLCDNIWNVNCWRYFSCFEIHVEIFNSWWR